MTIRIACISGYFGIGGMERTFLTLAENLGSQGYSFHFINLATGQFQDRFTRCGACFYSPDYNAVIAYLKDNKIDIVITCNSDEGSYLGYLAGVSRIIERPDGYSMAFYTDKSPVHAIVASTDRVYGALKLRYPEKYTTLIYNGVDLARFARSDQKEVLRRDHGISEDSVVIGYVGRIARTKCLDKLIDVFAGLAPRHAGIRLLLAGDEFPSQCGYRDELLRQAQQLGVAEKIFFLPASEHPDRLLTLCDIAVLASGSYRLPDGTCEVEGIPNAIMEAMAMELPVVATDSGETGLLVKHEKSGFIVGVSDWDAFTRHIEELVTSPSLRSSMGVYGRTVVQNSFSKDSMVAAYDRVFRFVLSDEFATKYPSACAKAGRHFLSHPFYLENVHSNSARVLLIRSGNKYLFDNVADTVTRFMPHAELYGLCTAGNRQDMEKYASCFARLFVCEHTDGFSADSMDEIIESVNTLPLDYVICLYNDLLGKQYDHVRTLMNRISSKNKLIANKLGRFFLFIP